MSLTDLAQNREQELEMRIMGCLNVLAECRLYCPEEEQGMIDSAIEDNLPEGWTYVTTLDRGDIFPPEIEA